jgi:ferredoxin-NADP reductase
LSLGWKNSLQSIAQQANSGSAASGNVGLTAAASSPPPAWAGFRQLTVTAVHDESANIRSFSLAALDGSALPKWLPGQSIALRMRADSGDSVLIRNYSLCNQPDTPEYRIGVKRERQGAGSGHLHSHVKVGDTLDVAAPRGTFFLTDGDNPVILLSAGVGVTPVLSMLHSLAGTNRPVWWLHGAHNRAEQAFAAEVSALLERLPNSRFRVCYSRPTPAESQTAERLSVEVITALGLPDDADAYLCGPSAFMADLSTALAANGLDPARIHTELFGAAAALTPGIATTAVPPHQPVGPRGTGPEISFARSGIAAPWGPPSTSLLEFAEACDVPTRWSCRTGVCHNCETALLSGAVRYDPEPLDPPAEGNILICCAQPVEDVVVDL